MDFINNTSDFRFISWMLSWIKTLCVCGGGGGPLSCNPYCLTLNICFKIIFSFFIFSILSLVPLFTSCLPIFRQFPFMSFSLSLSHSPLSHSLFPSISPLSLFFSLSISLSLYISLSWSLNHSFLLYINLLPFPSNKFREHLGDYLY